MTPLALLAAAAVTSVGADVDQTCTSIRAGIKRFKRHPWYEGQSREPGVEPGEPLITAPVLPATPDVPGPERLSTLLLPVLGDLVSRARMERRHLPSTALLLALPEEDAATSKWDLDRGFAEHLLSRAGLSFKQVTVNRTGRAGMLELLSAAADILSSRAADRVVLAGVDSYLAFDRMRHLDLAGRLKSPRNVDGFIPGEGASALLVQLASRVDPRGAPPIARVTALGRGDEPQPFSGDRQSTARGLVTALRAALPSPTPWVLCDQNGESYRAFEWAVAVTRASAQLGAAPRLSHPAINHGDIGAATGGVLAASVMAAFQRGYAPAPEAVLFAGSDGPARAAARLSLP